MRDAEREKNQERADLEKELQELQEDHEIRRDLARAEKRRLEAQKDELQRRLEDGIKRAAADAKEEAGQAHQALVAIMQQDLEEIKKKSSEECRHLLEQTQKIKEEKEAAEATNPETWLIWTLWFLFYCRLVRRWPLLGSVAMAPKPG